MKIIPPLRNSESKASGNKRSSEDPDDQIWDALILLNNDWYNNIDTFVQLHWKSFYWINTLMTWSRLSVRGLTAKFDHVDQLCFKTDTVAL